MDSVIIFSMPHFFIYTLLLNVRSSLTPVAIARFFATTVHEPFSIIRIVNQHVDDPVTPLVMIGPDIRVIILLFSLWFVSVMVLAGLSRWNG